MLYEYTYIIVLNYKWQQQTVMVFSQWSVIVKLKGQKVKAGTTLDLFTADTAFHSV